MNFGTGLSWASASGSVRDGWREAKTSVLPKMENTEVKRSGNVVFGRYYKTANVMKEKRQTFLKQLQRKAKSFAQEKRMKVTVYIL